MQDDFKVMLNDFLFHFKKNVRQLQMQQVKNHENRKWGLSTK